MKKNLYPLLFLLSFLTFFLPGLHAQISGLPFVQSVTAVNETGMNQSDYQVRLTVDTQTLISQGKLSSNGGDMRFGDVCSGSEYSFWIQDYINTDTTLIWVLLDSLGAGDTLQFGMYYGDTAYADSSNFNATFPNAFVSSGNANLAPGANFDWFEVQTGDTVFLAPDTINRITPRNAVIMGYVQGEGRGFPAPPLSNNGAGPGGGTWNTSCGSSGGSYGGLGGRGGYDSNDPVQNPTTVYGTTTGPDIDMGSTGGSSNDVQAGSGGGAFRLEAEWVTVTGVINCNGGLAEQPGGGQGGGGGAGGGILLHAEHLNVSGSFLANGNGGSIGTSSANDDGGGGGGGRIKFFWDGSLNNTATTSVLGGPGGQNGSAGTGDPGMAGTTHTDTLAFGTFSITIGTETSNSGAAPTISSPAQACVGETVNITVGGSPSSVTFMVGGTTVQSGTDSVYSYTADTTRTFIITSMNQCTYSDTVTVPVFPSPEVQLNDPVGSFCDGDTVVLLPSLISPVSVSILWSTGETSNSIAVTASGDYGITVTDSTGCTASDTASVTINPNPTPVIVQNGNTLSTSQMYASYQWQEGGTDIPGATMATYDVTSTGTFSVTVTDGNGCTGTSDTLSVMVGLDPYQTLGNVTATPNPFRDQINLTAEFSLGGDLSIEIVDLAGKVWVQVEESVTLGEWKRSLNVSELANGLYFVRIRSVEGNAVLRMVKQ